MIELITEEKDIERIPNDESNTMLLKACDETQHISDIYFIYTYMANG